MAILSLNILDASKPHIFIDPIKKINEGHDVSAFLTSQAYNDILMFLLQLNRAMFPCLIESITSHNVVRKWDLGSPDVSFSEAVQNLRRLLEELERIIDETPLDRGPRRFGNISFRKWFQTVSNRTPSLLAQHLQPQTLCFPTNSHAKPLEELSSYFLGSFGSAQRLDYGSGHELSFLAFLACIWKLGGFQPSPTGDEERSIVLGVIEPYLHLVRRLIKTYTLEPAGSHGVWGLDDHFFIPYIFGSAQYGPAISPQDQTPTEGSRADAPDPVDVARIAAVERCRGTNMYFGAIGFIHDVKKGPFWEHSPMLYDISGVKAGWAKINKGMIKMYNAEVLSKFPVVQHFRFGSLFSWDQDPNAIPPPSSIHTSSQPSQDFTTSSSHEMISQRGGLPPQQGTKAPWATGPSATPPNMQPGAVTAAAAAWVSRQPPATDAGPPPSTRFTRPNLPLRKPPDNVGTNKSDTQAMPPPTRAPWAKPP